MEEENDNYYHGSSLINVIFSWSLTDVLNRNLYKSQVKYIPTTFTSTRDYMNSFMLPLIEETRADLLSNMMSVSRAPTSEIRYVKPAKEYKPPENLLYNISFTGQKAEKNEHLYEPEVGDLIALADVRPRCIGDLNRPKSPFVIAYVVGLADDDQDGFLIFSSKSLSLLNFKKDRLFAVYLTNLTTNMRIWKALRSDHEGENMKIIKTVMQSDSTVDLDCRLCLYEETHINFMRELRKAIRPLKLDDSQETAVLSCVATSQCHHQNTVELIWGPPGTGKTKTVASLLSVLLKMKCRTLTCSPTNIAVLGVTKRLLSLVKDSLKYKTYGLGDIVLSGNKRRMNIDDQDDLLDIFLDHRVNLLIRCLNPSSGWKNNLEYMISLLVDPERLYLLYLESVEEIVEESETENEDKENPFRKFKERLLSRLLWEEGKEEKKDDHLTFEQFVAKRFDTFRSQLIDCIPILYTHLPTSFISLEIVQQMIKVQHLLSDGNRMNAILRYVTLPSAFKF